MDIFQTTVTACTLIYRFLEAHRDHSTQSKSLAARFRWDSRVLQGIIDHYTVLAQDASLSKKDADLLQDTAQYLLTLNDRLLVAQSKLEHSGRLSREVNRTLWVFRKNGLIELERELFEWTQRLDLRLLALPQQLRPSVIGEENGPATQFTPHLAAQMRMDRMIRLSGPVKQRVWQDLWIEDIHSRLAFVHPSIGQFVLADYGRSTVIIEHKPHPAHVLDDPVALEILKQQIGEFSAAMHSLNPKHVGLLRCVGFYHEPDPPAFSLLHEVAYSQDHAPQSLRDLLSAQDDQNRRLLPLHPLNQRFELARKLAAGVLFLHSIGWVHKFIQPQNILVLDRPGNNGQQFPNTLGDPYLVNFGLARAENGETDPLVRGGMAWDSEVYQHPDRQNKGDVRYQMVHDIYSVGVVLLELGLWRPLHRYSSRLMHKTPHCRQKVLLELAKEVEITMGQRYKDLVIWCLELDCGGDSGDVKYASCLMEALDEMSAALNPS